MTWAVQFSMYCLSTIFTPILLRCLLYSVFVCDVVCTGLV